MAYNADRFAAYSLFDAVVIISGEHIFSRTKVAKVTEVQEDIDGNTISPEAQKDFDGDLISYHLYDTPLGQFVEDELVSQSEFERFVEGYKVAPYAFSARVDSLYVDDFSNVSSRVRLLQMMQGEHKYNPELDGRLPTFRRMTDLEVIAHLKQKK